MANARSLRSWDVMWDKLQRLLGFNGVESPFGRDSNPVIDEARTLYVETWGNDNNPGTAAQPYRTIQAALDYLSKFTISADIEVRVGPGEFDGFTSTNLIVIEPYTVSVVGSVEVEAEVSNSGQVTSGASYSLTDSTQNWGSNALKGMMCEYESATSTTKLFAWIQANTATNLTLLLGTTPGTNKPYRIVKLATTILPTQRFATTSSIYIPARIGVPVRSASTTGLLLRRLRFDNRAPVSGTATSVRVSGQAAFAQCQFNLTIGGTGTSTSAVGIGDGGYGVFSACMFRTTRTGTIFISPGLSSRVHLLALNWFYGTRSATQRGVLFTTAGGSSLRTAATLFESLDTAVLSSDSSVNVDILGTFVDNNTCIDCRGSVRVSSSQVNLPTYPTVSSGNTNFVIARGGDKVGVHSGLTSGLATNDITMATANPVATYTLTQMRANTPQAVTDTLGTVVGATGVVL